MNPTKKFGARMFVCRLQDKPTDAEQSGYVEHFEISSENVEPVP